MFVIINILEYVLMHFFKSYFYNLDLGLVKSNILCIVLVNIEERLGEVAQKYQRMDVSL